MAQIVGGEGQLKALFSIGRVAAEGRARITQDRLESADRPAFDHLAALGGGATAGAQRGYVHLDGRHLDPPAGPDRRCRLFEAPRVSAGQDEVEPLRGELLDAFEADPAMPAGDEDCLHTHTYG